MRVELVNINYTYGNYSFKEILPTKEGYVKEYVTCDDNGTPTDFLIKDGTNFELYINNKQHFRDVNVPRGDFVNHIENNIYLEKNDNCFYFRYGAGHNSSVPSDFKGKIHIFVKEDGTRDIWCDCPVFDNYEYGYTDFNTYSFLLNEKNQNQLFVYGWSEKGNTEVVYNPTIYEGTSGTIKVQVSFQTEIDGLLIGELKPGETRLNSNWTNVLRQTDDISVYLYDRSLPIYHSVFWPEYYARKLIVVFSYYGTNREYWTSPKIYLWHEPDKTTDTVWPGRDLETYATKLGENRYYITFPEEYNYFILNYEYYNNGTQKHETIQTEDLSIDEMITKYGYITVSYKTGAVTGYNTHTPNY